MLQTLINPLQPAPNGTTTCTAALDHFNCSCSAPIERDSRHWNKKQQNDRRVNSSKTRKMHGLQKLSQLSSNNQVPTHLSAFLLMICRTRNSCALESAKPTQSGFESVQWTRRVSVAEIVRREHRKLLKSKLETEYSIRQLSKKFILCVFSSNNWTKYITSLREFTN